MPQKSAKKIQKKRTAELSHKTKQNELLFQGERFLQRIFDAILDGICVLDRDLNIVRVNKKLENVFADHMPIVGKKCYTIFHKTQSVCSWCPCTPSMHTGKVHTAVLPYPSTDKPLRWYEISAFPLKNDRGLVFGVIEYIKDITHYKLTEEKLRESEERYHNLFEESRDAIFISSREGKFIDVNRATLELFGFSREELIGKLNIEELYLHPSHRKKFQQEIEQKGAVRDFEIKLCKKDGSVMDCFLTSTIRLSHDKKVLGYQGIIRDITEFKRAEKALRESEARYRAVVEDQTEPICRFLPDRKITFVNQAYCRFFEKKYDEFIGHPFKPPIPEEDREIAEELFTSLSPEHPVTIGEHRVTLPNGEICWLQWTNRMLLDEHSHLIEFQSVGRDITRRKKIEEELKKSSEKIKLFAYSVSHDLKNPALSLYGLTNHLKKNYWDILDDVGRHLCDQISKTAEQIFALVEQINLFIATKESPLTIETVKLKEITQMIKEEFSPQFNIRQIIWDEPEYLPDVRANKIALLRALRNLVDNSLKYGGDELSKITIGYNDLPDFITFFVKDNGVGLKKESSKNVFGWFARFETSKGVEGTGIGLSIVKEIAEQHKGKAWVEPGLTKGITFYFSISKHL